MFYDAIKRFGYEVPDCPVFEISNVAAWCAEAGDFTDWGERELLKISDAFPPFENFFMEYSAVRCTQERKHNPLGFGRSLCADFSDAAVSKEGAFWSTKKVADTWHCRVARFFCVNDVALMSRKGEVDRPIVESRMFQTDAVKNPKPGEYRRKIRHKEVEFIQSFHIQNDGSLLAGSGCDWRDICIDLLPCLQALMFLSMHSNSVRVLEHKQPRSERMYAKHLKQPALTTFKTLVIKGIGPGTHTGLGGPRGGYSSHICRGHRKKFTAAAPLFGKIVGTFWWTAHTRGDSEVGEVKKVYEVRA